MGEIVMTIEEKAKEFAGYNISFPDGATAAEMDSKYDGFKAGAEWMLEKATQRFTNEVSQFNTLLCFIDKTSAGLINKEKTVEMFRKAMEE